MNNWNQSIQQHTIPTPSLSHIYTPLSKDKPKVFQKSSSSGKKPERVTVGEWFFQQLWANGLKTVASPLCQVSTGSGCGDLARQTPPPLSWSPRVVA